MLSISDLSVRKVCTLHSLKRFAQSLWKSFRRKVTPGETHVYVSAYQFVKQVPKIYSLNVRCYTIYSICPSSSYTHFSLIGWRQSQLILGKRQVALWTAVYHRAVTRTVEIIHTYGQFRVRFVCMQYLSNSSHLIYIYDYNYNPNMFSIRDRKSDTFQRFDAFGSAHLEEPTLLAPKWLFI